MKFNDAISLQFIRLEEGEISLADFESWVYANVAEEGEDFLRLLQVDFQQHGAKAALLKEFRKNIDYPAVHRSRLSALLLAVREWQDGLKENLTELRKYVEMGYHFLFHEVYAYDPNGFDHSILHQLGGEETENRALILKHSPDFLEEIKEIANKLDRVKLTGRKVQGLYRAEAFEFTE